MSKNPTIQEAAEAFTSALVALLVASSGSSAVLKTKDLSAADEPEQSPLDALKELAEKKDASLVEKILMKKFASNTIDELEEKDIAKATKLIEELDDAGEPENPDAEAGDSAITLDSMRALAKSAIKNGKSSELKKLLAKFKTESITDLDEKHHVKFNAELEKLAE